MAEFIVRGVPKGLRRDAWWMASDTGRGSVGWPDAGPAQQPPPPLPRTLPRGLGLTLALVVVFIALTDVMVWDLTARLGWVILASLLGVVLHWRLADVAPRRAGIAWAALALGCLPVLEEVQALSLGFLALGIAGFAVVLATDRGLRAVGWFYPALVRQVFQDLSYGPEVAQALGRTRLSPARLLRDWALPVVLGAVFVSLLSIANPVIQTALNWLGRWDPALAVDPGRVAVWLLAALVLWPVLRLAAYAGWLGQRTARAPMALSLPVALVNDRAVLRALVVFNLLFAVQSLTDLAYLWGGVRLPEGLSYAQYAHRGAYPLIVTALLAGGFALIAQPFLAGRPTLRLLLIVWVAQTVLLVVSSILRLDLYVGVYGMTRLRFAAFVWMGLVALGLALLLWQVLRRLPVSWVFGRSAVLALGTLYACAFVNVAGLVAEYNLTRKGVPDDAPYLCSLGPGAAPAIFHHDTKTGTRLCVYGSSPLVIPPVDFREWGYRNWRLRRNLAAMSAAPSNGQSE